MSEENKKDSKETVNVHVVNLASYVKPSVNESMQNEWINTATTTTITGG